MFLSLKKPSCALLTLGALAWSAGCTESASSAQPAWPLTPACLDAPSLHKAALGHPCALESCRLPGCRDLPSQETFPYVEGERLVCIDQNTYRCVPDDLAEPSQGRYELVEPGCCKVRSADLSLSFDVLERPRTWSDARLPDQGHPNGLCYDLSRSQLTFKARLSVTNRGNLPVRARCYVSWYPIYHGQEDIFTSWRTEYFNLSFTLDLDYGPPTQLDLAPGQSQRFEINHWPTPEELCPVYVEMNCIPLDEHPDVDPTRVSLVEPVNYRWGPWCRRERSQRVGDFELFELPEGCAESLNFLALKLNPQLLDQEP